MSTEQAVWRDEAPHADLAWAPSATAPVEPAGWADRLRRALTTARGRVRTRDLVTLVRHLATLLNAGLSLSKGLRTLARQFENPLMAAMVAELSDEVQGGEMLSSAMAMRPAIFDTLTINVVRAGEAGGTLPETLAQLADDLEKKEALRRAVGGAMVYPAIVLVIAMLVVGFVLIYVVPTFEGVYRKMKLELPLVTRALLFVSRLVLTYWWVPALVVGGLAASWRPLKRIEGFRRRWDRAALRLPLFGKLRRKAISARFLGAFSTLIGSGVSIVEALRLMGDLVDNFTVRDAIADIRRHVSRGGKVSEPLERYGDLFSPMAIQMISVGEETGSMPEAAARTARFLAQEVEIQVKTLTTLLEPLMTVALGLIVGTIVLAVYMPMFDLMKHISR